MTLPITACIITLNEEHNLQKCLQSLDFTDEIIIVDSGSTDGTIDIAQQFNADVYQRDFDNYVNQKNFCISKAKNHWILALDADEAISPQLKKELLLLTGQELQLVQGFMIPRLTYYLGKWIRYGGWYPNLQIRFFHKDYGAFQGMLVHERVVLEGKIRQLKQPILHYSYRDISDHLKFIDRYSTLTAQEKYASGKKGSVLMAICEGIWKFFSMYIIRLGFLDGRVGIVVAILGAYYNFLKYIKLYELTIRKNKSSQI